MHRSLRHSVVAAALVLLMFPPPVAQADMAESWTGTFDGGDGAAVVRWASKVFLLGGYGSTFDSRTIQSYDLATDTTTTLSAQLAVPVLHASAVLVGNRVYILGGVSPETGLPLNTIQYFDPVTEGTGVLPSTLHAGRRGGPAVTDGRLIYYLGGWSGPSTTSRDLVVYDTGTGLINVFNAKLHAAAAVHDGTFIYGFAATTNGGIGKEIHRLDPRTLQTTKLAAELPEHRAGVGAVWTGSHALLLGGYRHALTPATDVHKFDPLTGALTRMSATLPHGDPIVRAAWDGERARIFTDRPVMVYDPIPGAPQNLTARSGPGSGEALITWDPPASSTSVDIGGYRVFRTGAAGRTMVANLTGDVRTFHESGLPAGSHSYYVDAYRPGGGVGPATAAVKLAPQSATDVGQEDPGGQGDASDDVNAPTPLRAHEGESQGSLDPVTDPVDVYSLDLSAWGNVSVSVTPLVPLDLTLTVIDPNGYWRVIDERWIGHKEELHLTGVPSGTWRIMVSTSLGVSVETSGTVAMGTPFPMAFTTSVDPPPIHGLFKRPGVPTDGALSQKAYTLRVGCEPQCP